MIFLATLDFSALQLFIVDNQVWNSVQKAKDYVILSHAAILRFKEKNLQQNLKNESTEQAITTFDDHFELWKFQNKNI